MKKAIWAICITISLILNLLPAFADETADKKTYTLTLAEAIDMAYTDNPQLEACLVEQKSNKINLDAAYISKNRYKNAVVSTSNYSVAYIKGGYYADSYEAAIRLSDKKYEQVKASVAYNVTQSYFNYKLTASLLEVAEKALALASDNYDSVAKRYELGMISAHDLNGASLNVERCRNTVKAYERNLSIAKEDLKIKLGLDKTDCDFILTDEISVEEFKADLEADILSAEKNRYDINSLMENAELAKKYFDITKPLTETSATYQSAYSSYITADFNYQNNKKLILLSVRNTYNNVYNSLDNLKIAEKSLELAKTTYDINKIKFDNGMITNYELTASINDYLNSGVTLENAKLEYKLATEKYFYEISIGL